MRKTSLCVLLLFLVFLMLPPASPGSVMDLKGRELPESPNPIVPRWGLIPGIVKVSRPVLILRKTNVANPRGTILLCPGGGYRALAINHEGKRVADFLNNEGYDVAILEYSVGSSRAIRGKALKDARKAWSLLASHGGELGLRTRRLGIMGFSAGGHLAARLVHVLGRNHEPAFLVLIYPAYLDERSGSGRLDPTVAPPLRTPTRVFVLIGDRDKPQWISGAKAYASACRENGQEVQFCLLPRTGHGFGMKTDRTGPSSRWERNLSPFLQRR